MANRCLHTFKYDTDQMNDISVICTENARFWIQNMEIAKKIVRTDRNHFDRINELKTNDSNCTRMRDLPISIHCSNGLSIVQRQVDNLLASNAKLAFR